MFTSISKLGVMFRKACKRLVNRRRPRDAPVFCTAETAKRPDPEKTGGKVPAWAWRLWKKSLMLGTR